MTYYFKLEERYEVGNTIGSGSSCIVRECEDKLNQRSFACKSMTKPQRSTHLPEQVLNEVFLMKRLEGSDTVLALHDVFQDEHQVHLVMDLCKGGDLYDYVAPRGAIPEVAAVDIFFQVCKAVQHCHANGVVHRDIKPENIFLSSPGLSFGREPPSQDGYNATIKLGDFGLAKFLKPGQRASRLCGSAIYMAPEVLKGSYDYSADLWSLGILLYVLLTGFCPFESETVEDVQKQIAQYGIAFPPCIWSKLSVEAEHLVRSLLSLNPSARPNIEQVLSSVWVQHFFPGANYLIPSKRSVHQQFTSKVMPARASTMLPPDTSAFFFGSNEAENQMCTSSSCCQGVPVGCY